MPNKQRLLDPEDSTIMLTICVYADWFVPRHPIASYVKVDGVLKLLIIRVNLEWYNTKIKFSYGVLDMFKPISYSLFWFNITISTLIKKSCSVPWYCDRAVLLQHFASHKSVLFGLQTVDIQIAEKPGLLQMDLEFLSSPCLNLGQILQRLRFATSKEHVVNVVNSTVTQ